MSPPNEGRPPGEGRPKDLTATAQHPNSDTTTSDTAAFVMDPPPTTTTRNCGWGCWCGTAPPTTTAGVRAVATYPDHRSEMDRLAVAIRRIEVLRGPGALL